MKYCSSCGAELANDVKFCSKCGNKVNLVSDEEVANNQNTYQESVQGSKRAFLITKREIAIAIILSVVTCGIYSIYWFIVMTDDINKLSDKKETSGGMAFLFSLLTCGIYTFYWNYKMGKQLYDAGKRHGRDISDNSILYLILSLLGLGIVSYCLLQSDLNKFADK